MARACLPADPVSPTADRHFRVMGTRALLRVDAAAGHLLDRAEARLAQLERRWSRFLPDSEISVLNRAGGRPTIVSGDTIVLLRRAGEAHELTGGWFDPTLLPALEAAGYDRSHEQLLPDREPLVPPPARRPSAPSVGSLAIELDLVLSSVTLRAGMRIDPGGIGKGLAADIVAAELLAAGATSAMVDLGGDLRFAGPCPDHPHWIAHVEDPFALDRRLAAVHLTEGAVATSSRSRRRWRRHEVSAHHLIDPTTRRPSTSDVVAATVVGSTTWWAEVLAKSALLAGAERGRSLVEAAGCAGLLILVDGSMVQVGDHVRPIGEPVS